METRGIISTAVMGVGLVVAGYGIQAVQEVATAPENSQDVKDLQEFVSPDGNEARCASQRSQDFAIGLHGVELTRAEAEGFATVLADKGMEIKGDPVTADDLLQLNKDDLSNNPGFDCNQKGGASTHLVVESVRKNSIWVIGGLLGSAAAAGYWLRNRSALKNEGELSTEVDS